MTRDTTPTLVTLYRVTRDGMAAIARFRWSKDTGVSLDVIDETWGRLARRYYDDGLPLDRGHVVVQPREGERFMRALLEPRLSSYYRLVDETDGPAS